MRRTQLIALFGSLLWAQTAQASKPIIAVFDIKDSANVLSAASIEQLTNYFTVKLAETGRFIIVPRSDIEAALRAQKRASFKECFDQSCQIEVGKELAAQKTLQTQIVKLGSKCAVTGTLYDLRLAATEKAASQKSDCSEDGLVSALERLALALSGAPAVAKQATLSITTTPSGATLQLNGQPLLRKSPVSGLKLTPGKHSLSAVLGNLRKEMNIELRPSEQKSIALELKTPVGQLTLSTEPAGAQVKLDGKKIGDSPLVYKAPLGEHTLELSKAGFLEKRMKVKLQTQTTVSVKLAPAIEVDISTAPLGATIQLNKKTIGKSPMKTTVERGEHVFTAKLDGYQQVEHRVRASGAGQRIELRLKLQETTERREAKVAYQKALTDYRAQVDVYEKDNSSLLGWLGFGFGLAAAGASGGMFALSLKDKSNYNSAVLRDDLDSAHSSGRIFEIMGYSFGAAALGTIIYGIVQWSLGPDEPERPVRPSWLQGAQP